VEERTGIGIRIRKQGREYNITEVFFSLSFILPFLYPGKYLYKMSRGSLYIKRVIVYPRWR